MNATWHLPLTAAVVALMAALVAVSPAAGQADTHCAPGASPEFTAGFETLSLALGATMGNPSTCEYPDPSGTGDVEQNTSTGLAFWRKSTNTPTFTNGGQHWAYTASGWRTWTGTSIDPPSTAQAFVPTQTSNDQPQWTGWVAATPATFTSVSATWQQPAVTCPTSDATVSIWVGITGPERPGGLEQDGTSATCHGTSVTYGAWWEMFPAGAVNGGLTVAPGDTITSSVTYNPGPDNFTLQVQDVTTGKSLRTDQTCRTGATCPRVKADWIVERPTIPGGVHPLADFSTVGFTNALASTGGASLNVTAYDDVNVTMTAKDTQTVLATSGSLSDAAGGSTFTTSWVAAQ